MSKAKMILRTLLCQTIQEQTTRQQKQLEPAAVLTAAAAPRTAHLNWKQPTQRESLSGYANHCRCHHFEARAEHQSQIRRHMKTHRTSPLQLI